MKKYIAFIAAFVLSTVLLSGCGMANDELKDGYFTAEMSDYHHGWKEFVTICVKGGTIVSVEYNAQNPSGFIKSWDMAYMRNMNSIKGTYPNRYTREYAKQVIENQSAEGIDTVSGATSSGGSFQQLIEAAINMSKSGSTDVTIVQSSNE
ncbi:MAG: FMN-binding protein [Clostridiales bacterium]|jgi:major membrane immunogen (membrane-anchored lipoprotein)|nr:FMN-binding protein [Clostridiales bacterium]